MIMMVMVSPFTVVTGRFFGHILLKSPVYFPSPALAFLARLVIEHLLLLQQPTRKTVGIINRVRSEVEADNKVHAGDLAIPRFL